MPVTPPTLLNKHYAEPTVFTAENLLREASRREVRIVILNGRLSVERMARMTCPGDGR